MNTISVEYGWLIRGLDSWNQVFPGLRALTPAEASNRLENGPFDYEVAGFEVESHPWNPAFIFISLGELKQGSFPKEPQSGASVRAWFANHCPHARVGFGVIRTER